MKKFIAWIMLGVLASAFIVGCGAPADENANDNAAGAANGANTKAAADDSLD